MAFFVGEFDAAIDGKRRLSISAALREAVDAEQDGDTFILIVSPDRHLWLYPERYYQRLVGAMRRSPLPTREQRRVDLLFAMARRLKPDGQGRVVLPESSMRRATVSDRVTLLGNRDHIEIWPTDEWQARLEQDLPSYGDMLYEAADRLQAEAAQNQK